MSFQGLIDAVESLLLDDQSLRLEFIHRRIVERRGADLVAEVHEARREFMNGEIKLCTVEDLMTDLRDGRPLSGAPVSGDSSSTLFAVDQKLSAKIEQMLVKLAEDISSDSPYPQAERDLAGSWACTVDFEYRIVFEFVKDPETGEDMILLEAVGNHEEVH